MKTLMKLKEYLKRTIAMTVAASLVMFQMVSDVAVASMSVEENGYTAIVTEKLGKFGRLFEINGQINETPSIPDMHEGIISMLSEDTETSEYSFAANTTDYANEYSIYSGTTATFNCNTAMLNGVIVAERDITVNASSFSSEEYTILYTKNGNININVAEMDFKGLLYAPNGNITINGTDINITGTMVAKGINLYIDTFVINASQFSDSMVNILRTFRNDKLLTLTGYTYEDDIIVGFESDADYERVDIYIRNDNAAEFTYLTSTTEVEYTISDYTFEQYMDIMAVAKTAYGDSYDSTLMTVGYSNDEYAEKLASYANDTDEDGIMDGIEVWYSKTNPNNADSDGDGFNDYIECFYLCTDPNVKNESADTDGDGINDANEVTNGTHPYLKDSDFDGYLDDNDIEPLKYNAGSDKEVDYTEDRVVGLFDKVNTWIDENGNVYQYIYNFINDNVEYTMINGVITKYYYNANNQLMAVVTMNGDVMDAVTYTYNGEVLSSVAYNGLLYEFATTENSENITIAGNTYKDAVYGENEQIVTYGNGYESKTVYNEYGDATAIYYNGALAFECEYDENGQVVKVADYVTGYEQCYTYKEDGNIDTITSDNYNIAYEYNDEEYVINYDVNGNEFVQVIYNDTEDKYVSQYSSLLISGGFHENIETEEDVVEYKITKDGNVVFSNLLTYDGSTVTNISYNNGDELAYEYTKEGNISSVLQNGDKVIEYYYDNLGRVVREDNALAGKSYEFVYNEDNNMSLKREYSYSTDELTELLKEESFSYENPWKDQVTSIDGDAITYDEVGNPISYRDGMNFEWSGKTLSGVNGIADIEFTYNNEGIRTSKTVDGVKTEYVIEGKDIVFEIGDNGTTAYIYDSDMNVIGMICDGATYYFEKNVQSDVVRVLDEEGNILCEYVYDAWGNVVLVDGDVELANKNPFRYRSYYYDVETGLYYAESRYYDPETGRFINADKIEAIVWDYTNLNMYVYCGNDPVNYYDPSGEAGVYVKTFISRDLFDGLDGVDEEDANEYIQLTRKMISTNQLWQASKGAYGDHTTYVIDNKQEFIESWNAMLIANVVVIYGHGGPYSIQFSDVNSGEAQKNPDKYSFTTSDVNKLENKSIKFVWLVSCNVGHYDKRTENIAFELAKKVTGVVIAPDGVVMGVGYTNSTLFTTFVYHDTSWYSYMADIKSTSRTYGWLIYKSWTSTKVTPYLYTSGVDMKNGKYNLMNIYNLSSYLVSTNYVSFK